MKKSILAAVSIFFVFVVIFLLSIKNLPTENSVTFWTLQMGDFEPYINEVIENFEEQNPKIRVNWVDVPFSEGEKRTLAAILSDNPPDLINLNPDFSAILAQKGALEEINPDVAEDFLPEIVKSLEYNGKLYAIPWYATSAITIYNKELYTKAGYVTPPATYDRLAAIAEVIKGKTGAYPFMPTLTENNTLLKVLNKFGINSWKNINNARAIDVFRTYKKLYDKNLIPKEIINQTQREALEKYMSGQIVFFESGANFLNLIQENAPSIYEVTDVAPQIKGRLGQNDFSLMNLVIPLKSNNKKNALKFALFLTNEKNQLQLAKLTNIISPNKKTLKNAFYTRYRKDDLMSKARYISAKQLREIHPVLKQIKGQKEINLLLSTAIQEILINNADIKETLDEVAVKWENLAE